MDFKLILKKLKNTLNKEEETLFSNWYNESSDHKAYFNKVKANFPNNLEAINTKVAWNAVDTKIGGSKKKNNYWKYGIAASLLLFMALSYVILNQEESKLFDTQIVKSSISAGTDKATLTLEDGSSVRLEKGNSFSGLHLNSNGEQLIYKHETSINPEVEYNYLTVPLGGEFFVELSDNTKIWLNSDSKIKFPVTFKEGETRTVELLYGEAYFDVSSSSENNGSAFKVYTKNQHVEVIGTEFNIRAYQEDEVIYTSLVEGKINVETSESSEVLTPNQQSIVNTTTHSLIKIPLDNIEKQIAWKNGQFIFDKKPLKDIMTTLSRWYDISFEFENIDKQYLAFSGVLDRSKSIDDLLNSFQKTREVSFNVIDRTIIIN